MIYFNIITHENWDLFYVVLPCLYLYDVHNIICLTKHTIPYQGRWNTQTSEGGGKVPARYSTLKLFLEHFSRMKD